MAQKENDRPEKFIVEEWIQQQIVNQLTNAQEVEANNQQITQQEAEAKQGEEDEAGTSSNAPTNSNSQEHNELLNAQLFLKLQNKKYEDEHDDNYEAVVKEKVQLWLDANLFTHCSTHNGISTTDSDSFEDSDDDDDSYEI